MMHPSSPLGKENNSSDEFDFCDRAKSTVPKKTMKASELLKKYPKGRGLKSLSSDNASDDGSTPFRGRKGSDSMKYSSLSPPERRAASAKTLTDQCFPRDSSAWSSSPESLLVDSYADDGKLAESYILDEEEASPESRKIMEEMEQIYESSPIPKSYLNSPPKKSQVLPDIVLNPKSLGKAKLTVAKKSMEASELLEKQGMGRKGTQNTKGGAARSRAGNEPSTTSFAATKAAYGGSKTRSKRIPRQLSSADASSGTSRNENGRQARETFSAPNDSGGVSTSLEWGTSAEKPSKSAGMARTTTTKKPVALSVQREKQQRKTRLKETKSSSNEVDGRRMLDKRTARLRFADGFEADIMQHRQRLAYLNNGSNHSDKTGSQIQDRSSNGVSIAVRKRPIFDYELDRGDYDIVSIDNSNQSSHDVCIIHKCVMHADMKTMLMKPTSYPVTAAFDEHCGDDDIYRHIAEPLVLDAVNEGVATILMYGQTGSGKSHTMSGIETRVCSGLFEAIDSKFANQPQSARPVVTIQFVELCGSKEVRDLLVKKSGEVKLLDDEDGSVRLLNAVSHEVKSPEDLLGRIMLAKGRRATEATEKNGVSSRSHAVCQIQIKGKSRGLLTLIDCAGSERSHDSMYHSSERQKECAEINASLYALKECIRARANKNARIPFRSSSLTRILKESFERDGARLCVIACAAPNATDTEHTMETLKTVASIVGVDDQIKEEKAHVVTSKRLETRPAILPPKQWDHDHLKKFLAHKKMNSVQLSEKHDGKALMKMSVPQMRAHFFEDKEKELAQKLFDLLRKENDRVTQIQRKEREIMKKERKGRV
eukprot:CAMPEP_0201884998 /NCGR_PEP_ID=MMETSP0902-20130614/17664_1 /ASSEMBLY_ACC=CAM_ASM_000551 /TAXON_ID=420261 /ORGANISM="Thalassiosira antarctica, Strain CCMP982" /LENGTH=824 /DNA_ID=CAMNT_0048414021 /DNA_START=149 /DNA_END=2623 /DNA_ORIENTATION=-